MSRGGVPRGCLISMMEPRGLPKGITTRLSTHTHTSLNMRIIIPAMSPHNYSIRLAIEQCLLHIRAFFGGKTKRPFFLSFHPLAHETNNELLPNHFSRSHENRSILCSSVFSELHHCQTSLSFVPLPSFVRILNHIPHHAALLQVETINGSKNLPK